MCVRPHNRNSLGRPIFRLRRSDYQTARLQVEFRTFFDIIDMADCCRIPLRFFMLRNGIINNIKAKEPSIKVKGNLKVSGRLDSPL